MEPKYASVSLEMMSAGKIDLQDEMSYMKLSGLLLNIDLTSSCCSQVDLCLARHSSMCNLS